MPLDPFELTVLEQAEVFLRQISRMTLEHFEQNGAAIHEAAQVHADFVESILERNRNDG